MQDQDTQHLAKFLYTSAACFFVGTVHGVVQIQQPIRGWLDSIGSPIWGPGHMIDPLAHVHMNVIGGVVIFIMGVTYYLLPRMIGTPIYSQKMITHTYWWTIIGLIGFYTTLMVFGIWEGILMLENPTDSGPMDAAHRIYGPVIGTVSTIMGMGFWIFFANIALTAMSAKKQRNGQ